MKLQPGVISCFVMLALMLSLAAFLASLFAYHSMQAYAPPVTVAKCRSEDALAGLSWKVDLLKDLEIQSCRAQDGDGEMHLYCDRQLTVECEMP